MPAYLSYPIRSVAILHCQKSSQIPMLSSVAQNQNNTYPLASFGSVPPLSSSEFEHYGMAFYSVNRCGDFDLWKK
jgi:hypothetical protein